MEPSSLEVSKRSNDQLLESLSDPMTLKAFLKVVMLASMFISVFDNILCF